MDAAAPLDRHVPASRRGKKRPALGRGTEGDTNGAPMVEIFGGIFALLLVLFLIMNLLSQAALVERLEAASDEGLFRVGWGPSGSGFVVLAFPSELRIVETGEAIGTEDVCAPQSPFVAYARQIYHVDQQQLIFAILEHGVVTMAKARNCLMRVLPNQTIAIGWIIANDELLKSVALNDIPAFVTKAVANPEPIAP